MPERNQQSQQSQSNMNGGMEQKIPQSLNIKLVFEQVAQPGMSQGKQTVQLVEDYPISQHIDPETQSLCLKSLIIDLTSNYNFSFQSKEIHFYLEDEEVYMNCGLEPLSSDIKIALKDFVHNTDGIRIKARRIRSIALLHKLMALQNPVQNDQEKEREVHEEGNKSRRTKERRIGYIIEKVIEWRKHYHGTTVDGNLQPKLSLDQAAQEVKISKKSLDDYLFQIRFGHKFKFNFNEHYNDKVGVLRDFVRSKKKADKQENKMRKNERNIKLQ